MESLTKLLGPIIGSTNFGSFHMNSNSHRSGDCPCKLMTSSCSIWTAAETNDYDTVYSRINSNSALASKLDAYGYTALHYAAQHNHVRIVIFLLSKGCPPDANGCGATPLHRASYSGSLESCELLLKAGADVNAIDSSYRDMGSPLHKAYSVANVPAVTLLLSYGANSLQLDASGKTPVQLLKKKFLEKFQLSTENTDGVATDTEESSQSNLDPKKNEDLGRRDVSIVVSMAEKASENDIRNDEIESVMVPTSLLQLSSKPFLPSTIETGLTMNANKDSLSRSNSVGLQCSLCEIKCISFTRLLDGSLICTECKYRDPVSKP